MSAPSEGGDLELVRRVGELVNAMARPLFVWRMAGPLATGSPDTALTRSARTRLANAAREIDRLVALYSAHSEALDAVD